MNSKAKIFFVDDDVDLVMVARSVFEAEGYSFASANSAKEALEKIGEVKPDLIILDVMMEDIVAGFRVVNALRNFDEYPQNKAYEDVPILMLTSVQQRMKMKFSEDAGSKLLPIDSFLEKPVKPRVLLEKVASLLEARPKS
jgi:CheY-like chemotaxis protein